MFVVAYILVDRYPFEKDTFFTNNSAMIRFIQIFLYWYWINRCDYE